MQSGASSAHDSLPPRLARHSAAKFLPLKSGKQGDSGWTLAVFPPSPLDTCVFDPLCYQLESWANTGFGMGRDRWLQANRDS